MAKIGILGTGAWGTALANILLENGHTVYMWGVDHSEINDLKKQLNSRYYGNKKLIKKPHLVTSDIDEMINQHPTFIIIAIPSIHIVSTLNLLVSKLNYKCYFINVSKGLEQKTNDIWSKTIKKIVGKKLKGLVTLIGPSFAVEVFNKEPTIINSVSSDLALSRMINLLFNNSHFKCVEIKDEVGAEIIGALKNVLAIAMGLSYKLHASINTRAAMLSQGVKEINKLVQVYGGNTSTIAQFCGIGDIYLTCTDTKSRNFSFGQSIGTIGIKKAIANNKKTVEGYYAAKIIHEIIVSKKINSPIFNEIYDVLYKNKNHKDFVKNIIKEIIE